jgi:hypothetical protein
MVEVLRRKSLRERSVRTEDGAHDPRPASSPSSATCPSLPPASRHRAPPGERSRCVTY